MIISNMKDKTTLLAGTRVELTVEATNLFGAMLEKTPEVFLASLAAYSDELEKSNFDNLEKRVEMLMTIAEVTKKSFKESKFYGD